MLSFLRKYLAVFVFIFLVLFTIAPIVYAQTTMPPNTVVPASIGEEQSGIWSWFSGATSVLSWGASKVFGLLGDLIFFLFTKVVEFFAFLAWIMGSMMDYTFYYTVVDFTPKFVEIGGTQNTTSNTSLIYYGWSMIRDILNAGIFFIIIYHAIRSMFQGFEDIKKKFIALLIFTVLVNFSLLFVKLAADISNIAMLQIYNAAAKPVGSANTKEFFTHRDDLKNTGLSSFVLNAVNPLSFFSEGRAKVATVSQIQKNSQTVAFQISLILIYLYLAALFLYMTAIFMVRAVTFLVIMIMSPLLIAGSFFSGLSEAADTVKGELKEEVLQGPGVLLMLILSGMVASGLFAGTSFNPSDPSQSNSVLLTNIGAFLKFGIFAAFNYYAFSFIRKATSTGGNWAEKLTGGALATGIGLGAWGLRRTIGGAANYLYNNDNYAKEWARTALDEKSSWLQKRFANAKLKTVGAVRNSSFDLRSGMSAMQKTAMGAKILTSLKTGLPLPNLNVGKGTDKSAAKLQLKRDEAENKRRDDWRKVLGETGSSLWTVKDERLINEGLVKADYDGKSRDIRNLNDIQSAVADGTFQSDIATKIASGLQTEKIKRGDTELTADEWQKMIDREVAIMLDKANIGNSLMGLTDEEADVAITTSTGTATKKVKDWRKEADKLNKQAVAGAIDEAKKQLTDITKREKLVAKYAEKSKKSIEEAFDREQGKGNIGYIAELPYMAVRRSVRAITGQQRSGGDSRANMKAAKRYEQAIAPNNQNNSQARYRVANLIRNAFDAKDFTESFKVNYPAIGLPPTDKDLKIVEDFLNNSSKHTVIKNGKVEVLDKSERERVIGSLRNIVDIFAPYQTKMNKQVRDDYGKVVKALSDVEESFSNADAATG